MQGVFDFCQELPVRPRRPDRLFLAILLDIETALAVGQFRRRFICDNHVAGSLIRPDRLHTSLHHIGDYARLKTRHVHAVTDACKALFRPSFEAIFRWIMSFESAPAVSGRAPKRPLVLLGESADLFDLHRTLGVRLGKYGLRTSEHFQPHMTLLYGPDTVPLQPVEPIRIPVKEVVLIHSKLGLTQYEILERWPLAS